MGGPWWHHAKWNESDSKRQILYEIIHMWNPKEKKKNLIDTENRLMVDSGWKWAMGKMHEGNQNI